MENQIENYIKVKQNIGMSFNIAVVDKAQKKIKIKLLRDTDKKLKAASFSDENIFKVKQQYNTKKRCFS